MNSIITNNINLVQEAEFHYREAVKHNPRHYRAFYNLGNLLLYATPHLDHVHTHMSCDFQESWTD